MKNEINFLKHYRKKVETIKDKDRKPFRAIVVFFVVILIFLGVSIFTKIYFQKQVDLLLAEKTNLENQIKRRQKEEQEYINFYAKFQMIADVLTKRYDGMNKVDYISNMKSDDLRIREINYQLYDRFIDVVVETDTVFMLEGLLKEFEREEIKSEFSKIKKESLNRLSNGKYQLMLKFYLKEFKG